MNSLPLILPVPLRKSQLRCSDTSFFLSSSTREENEILDVSGDVGVVGRLSKSEEETDGNNGNNGDNDNMMMLDFKGCMFRAAFRPTMTTFVVSLSSEKARIESIMNSKLQLMGRIQSDWLNDDQMGRKNLDDECDKEDDRQFDNHDDDDDEEEGRENRDSPNTKGGVSAGKRKHPSSSMSQTLLLSSSQVAPSPSSSSNNNKPSSKKVKAASTTFFFSSHIAVVLAHPNGGPTVAVNSVTHGGQNFHRQTTPKGKQKWDGLLTGRKHRKFRNFLEKHVESKGATYLKYAGDKYKVKLAEGAKIKYDANTGKILHYETVPGQSAGILSGSPAKLPKTTIKDGKGNLLRSYETLADGSRQHYNAKGEKTFITTKGQADNGYTPITKTSVEGHKTITETLFLKKDGSRFIASEPQPKQNAATTQPKANEAQPKGDEATKPKVDEATKPKETEAQSKASEPQPKQNEATNQATLNKIQAQVEALANKKKDWGPKILKGLGYGAGAYLVLALLNAVARQSSDNDDNSDRAASSTSSTSSSSSSSSFDPLISKSTSASSLPPTIPSSAGFPSMSGFSGTPPAVPAF